MAGGLYDLWKRTVPMDARMYLQTLFGDRSKPFTEADFTPQELKQLEDIVRTSSKRNQRSATDELSAGERYMQYVDKLKAAGPVLHEAATKDKEWQELGQLQRKYPGSLTSPDVPRDIALRKDQLWRTLGERYFPVLGSESIYDMIGSKPEEVNNYVSRLVNYYVGNEQGKQVQESMERSRKHLADPLSSGSVQYEDYDEAKNPGDILTSLGRFVYRTEPTGDRVIKDTYDFDNSYRQRDVERYKKKGPVAKALSVAKDALYEGILDGGGLQGLASPIGNAYIGDKGRPVLIKYKPENLPENAKGGAITIDDGNPAKRRKLI